MLAPMADATPADVLRSRLRKYFVVVIGMIFGAIALLITLGALAKTLSPTSAGMVMGVLAPIAMISVVIGSWVAVSKLWRCPACDKNVYWLVSMNMSILAATAQSNCPACGVELFPVADRKRRTRRFVILIALAVGLGMAGAMTSGFLAQKSRTQQTPPPPPPG
jgi:hypothetical protein